LQYRIAFDNAFLAGIVYRPIEGMSDGACQCACGVAGQLRVGIQGDDITDRSENGRIADDIRKCTVPLSPQQGIELLQFAAFALVSHPHPFDRIPHPGSMKQIEDARAVFTVGLVEHFNRCARMGER